MSFEPREYLRHIHVEIEFLRAPCSGLTLAKYPMIEWRAMSGMRNRLIHDYFGVDYELVWDVVQNQIPTLRSQIGSILEA